MSRVTSMSFMTIALAAATGCIPMPSQGNGTEARLRVIHASPDAPAVDICANGQPVFTNVAFPSATAYAALPPGTYAVRVTPAGAGCSSAGVINANLTLAAGQDISVVAVNQLAQIEPLVLTDDNTAPSTGKAKVRFVHASPNAPAVNITLADGTTLFSNVAFKQASGYLEVAAGTYNLQVRDTTGTVVVLPLNNVQLSAGKIYTVFAVGLLNGNPALNALVSVDN